MLDMYLPLGAASFVGAFLTACMGVGGGAFLLLIMAFYFPPALLIPLHGVVQLGANLGRAATLWKAIDKRCLLYFTAGATLGSAVGAQVFFALPEQTLTMLIAIGVLLLTWMPKPKKQGLRPLGVSIMASVTSFLSLFVGATGILVAPYLGRGLHSRHAIVGTHAGAMLVQHTLKIAVFGFAGFNFAEYAPLLMVMLGMGLLGTLAGRYLVLDKISDKHFGWLFKLLLTTLALNMVYKVLA